ncbi:hypothetical protein AGMMS49965_24930 [Bacteroidia bacterium]|nr:hypothetical protein AGMMS49965_24930 [Bacteroidia bacterium]GHT53962.1 hypothetical protein AGMMS49982_17900 [Bacteroidia bacterium]
MATAVKKKETNLVDEAINLLLKRSGVSKKELVDYAIKSWANDNLDLFTSAELKKYQSVIL